WNASSRPAYMMNSGGLLWIMPLTILAMARFRSNERRLWRFLWLACSLYIILFSIFSPKIEGIHWGPRFITHLIPLILLAAVTRAKRWWTSYHKTRPVIMLLVIISILNQFYSVETLWETRHNNSTVNQWVAQDNSEPVLTDMWWFPSDCGLHSDQSLWFLTDTPERVQRIILQLRHQEMYRFNFYEKPPYINEEFWQSIDPDDPTLVEYLGSDYFKNGELRRSRFQIHTYEQPNSGSSSQ
ncbi:MAG: hypothetical protein P9M15_04885, partial [Candidatus Electryoneaceae bacterium]|nr:hypothetical protein [Candidatus Electryoneaceae bacterium]